MAKKARNAEDAWNMQLRYEDGEPHGWIQWQGTFVCMDVYCVCGHHSHLDDEFAFHIKCPECGRVYFCNGHIEFIELEEEPDECVRVPDK